MDLRIAADPPPAAEEGARATASPQGSLDRVNVLNRARRAALEKLGSTSAQAPSAQPGYADVLAARPAPSPAIRLNDARTAPIRTQGYAPAPALVAPAASSASTSSTATSSTAKTSTSSSTSASAASTKSDFAFLSDKKLSIEDKLFQFMLVVQKKEDQQLQKKMKQYADKYEAQTSSSSGSKTSSTGSSSKSSGIGGLFGGLLEDMVGGALSILGLGGGGSPLSVLGDLAAELGGTVLAGALTAIGLPALVPIAASIGDALGGAINQATGTSGSSSSSATSTSTWSKPSGSTTSTTKPAATKTTTTTPPSAPSSIEAGDERLDMLEIQRMVEKQNQMFQLISNVLAGMNDTAMNVIANVR